MYRIIILILFVLLVIPTCVYSQWSPEVLISRPGETRTPFILANDSTIHIVYEHHTNSGHTEYQKSTDNGFSWSEAIVLSDTSMSNAAHNTRILRYGSTLIAIWRNGLRTGQWNENIGYSVSYNNGGNWSYPYYIFSSHWDRVQYYAVSNHEDNISIIFSNHNNNALRFYSVNSSNFGISWSDTNEVFAGAEMGKMEMVSYDSTVHLVWNGNLNEVNEWEIHYSKSYDYGSTWTSNETISADDDLSSIFPSIDVNNQGCLIISWTDMSESPYWLTGDVFIRKSEDLGESWSPEERITSSHKVKESNSYWIGDTIHVAFEDHRNNDGDIYYQNSIDNGLTWGPEYRIEDHWRFSYTPVLTTLGGKIHLIWFDRRNSPDSGIYEGIYYSYSDLTVGMINDNEIIPNKVNLIAHPNPFNSSCKISVSNSDINQISIYDISGRLVEILELLNGQVVWDSSNYSAGVYFARAKTSQSSQVVKLIYLK